MTDKKQATSLKAAGATQKISKEELAHLLKKAEEEDPDAEQGEANEAEAGADQDLAGAPPPAQKS